jgi:hypothetical protein
LTLRTQPLLLAGLAAAVTGLGSIGWMAFDLTSQAGAGERASLLDLLDDIGKPGADAPPSRPPGTPPCGSSAPRCRPPSASSCSLW